MDNAMLMDFMIKNMLYIVGGLGVLVIVMYIIIINLYLNLSYLKKRYRKMMTGVDDGANIERMLMGHIDETKAVAEENARIKEENKRIDGLLQKDLTHIGVVRFSDFEDMGSDLSYAVALLDSHNDGIILSSIFGREDSRSYVKPVSKGTSTYTLTEEEEESLHKAMQS